MRHRRRSGGSSALRLIRRPIRSLEILERRDVPATFTVSSLGDSGPGTLRQAILDANALSGPDTIEFAVAGTIQVGKQSLPAVTDTASLNGETSMGGGSAKPVVTIDFKGTKGLWIAAGADGSAVRCLSLINASNAGITIDASRVTVEGSYIGLMADGTTAAGNRGDGIQINPSSTGNVIGRIDPLLGINYLNSSSINPRPGTWTGITATNTADAYYMVGTGAEPSDTGRGLLYTGSLSGTPGSAVFVNAPGASATRVNGVDNPALGTTAPVGSIVLGGSRLDVDDHFKGFIYSGSATDVGNPAGYTSVTYPGAIFTSINGLTHSIPNGQNITVLETLAVGTAQTAQPGPVKSFIYNASTNAFVSDINIPGQSNLAAYGIAFNPELGYYTICGEVGGPNSVLEGTPSAPTGSGFLVDYVPGTGAFLNFQTFAYPNGAAGSTYHTRFQGMSEASKGVFNIAANSVNASAPGDLQGSFVTIRRESDGSFGHPIWIDLHALGQGVPSSANATYGNKVVGDASGKVIGSPYQAMVEVGFQLSNVISGNGGNGIGVYGSSDNQIAMNFIGTDDSGTVAVPNKQNGVLFTRGASRNMLGGQATAGNDPTAGVFTRPAQGNLISGNRGNGVLINQGSTQNILSGNFIGTAASGVTSLGNKADGVAIVGANGNQLVGCLLFQDPFVFYNVISGNDGNGLRITNSNGTVIQANFLGTGADNTSLVPNKGDGFLASGTSRDTKLGGPIPLGNVISGNRRNGVEVRDKVSRLESYNTFAGTHAFGAAAPNGGAGTLITSTGGGILIRTTLLSGNLGAGLEIAGNAWGVVVAKTLIGTTINSQSPEANHGPGILIRDSAHDNLIGGDDPSIAPEMTVSGNDGYGIAIVGKAYRNVIIRTNIGTRAAKFEGVPNGAGGIYLGKGTHSNRIGGTTPDEQVRIGFNQGNGITIDKSTDNTIIGALIGSNTGSGIALINAEQNRIGSARWGGNTISDNGRGGIYATGDLEDTVVEANTVTGNTGNGFTLINGIKITIGGPYPSQSNAFDQNTAFGLYASGNCHGSLAQGNSYVDNGQGAVNVRRAHGLTLKR